jgi:hypothetical protein
MEVFMHKWIAMVGMALLGLLPCTIKAVDIDTYIEFGDSYFDTGAGNFIAEAIGAPLPNPSPPYVDGRHSNGPIWADFLREETHTRTWTFAVSGAETGSGKMESHH